MDAADGQTAATATAALAPDKEAQALDVTLDHPEVPAEAPGDAVAYRSKLDTDLYALAKARAGPCRISASSDGAANPRATSMKRIAVSDDGALALPLRDIMPLEAFLVPVRTHKDRIAAAVEARLPLRRMASLCTSARSFRRSSVLPTVAMMNGTQVPSLISCRLGTRRR